MKIWLLGAAVAAIATASPAAAAEYAVQTVTGWTVRVSPELMADEPEATRRALALLTGQLHQIARLVPEPALAELRQVPLWISPPYRGFGQKAEYHPDPGWLRAHGRDPAMARAVEFTNVRIFEPECRRMPMLALHELAHAYHHRVLGYEEPRIRAAFERATHSGRYNRVERRDADGRPHLDRAYALSNAQEYFAETTEAFFGTNDFFPFTRDELKTHDPGMFALLGEIWGTRPEPARIRKTAPALKQAPINFNNPPRSYETRQVRAWTVLVEEQLLAEDPGLAGAALERLDQKLGEAMAVLPRCSHERLQRLPLFLLYGIASNHGGRDNGLEYFQRCAPQHFPHLDPRMAGSIVIYSATNYVWLSEFWALKALVHELAHAQHLEQWPETRADIFDAWEQAEQRGLYRQVPDHTGQAIERAYAVQNHLEYFAELSCMYFMGCNYAPFTRAELQAYDPAGYALIEKLWGH